MMEKIGPLVAMAVGDSYGAGFEYVPDKIIRAHNDLSAYRSHPKWKLPPGHYTDDTQMAIALAELLLSKRPLTTFNLATAFVSQFQADPRPGYSSGFYALLQQVRSGKELLQRLDPHSAKNGGAMRAAPCGLLSDTNEVLDTAMWQAALTHATWPGMIASAASAMTVYFCRKGAARKKLGDTVWAAVPGLDKWWDWEREVGAHALSAVRAAITAIQTHETMSGILKACIAFGGDVDTVAAIAMPAAALHPKIEQDLPQHLFDGLENGKYGLDYLRDLDQRLTDTFLTPPKAKKDAQQMDTDDGLLGMFA